MVADMVLDMAVKGVIGGIGGLAGGAGLYFMGTRMINDFTGIEQTNRLYKCGSCKRYARQYAMELAYWEAKLKGQDPTITNDVCPHCGKHSRMNRSTDNYSWLKTNPDCFRINLKQYFKNRAAIRKVKQGIEDLKSMKAFMEYYDLKEATPEVMEKWRQEVNSPLQTASPFASMSSDGMIIHNYPDEQHDFLDRNGVQYVRDHADMEWLPVRRKEDLTKKDPGLMTAAEFVTYSEMMRKKHVSGDEAAEHAAAMKEAWAKVGVNLNEYEKNQGG